MADTPDDIPAPDPATFPESQRAFDIRMRAHEMEQMAWDSYATAFIRILFDQGRSSRSKDIRAELAANVARHADAMLRERRRRYRVRD